MNSPFVDVHAHFLTDPYVAAARAAGIEHPDGMPGWPSFSLDDQLATMDRRGIARAVLSISSPGVHFTQGPDHEAAELAAHVNDTAAGLVEGHPERFAFFASLPLPDVDAAVRELERSVDLGARGIIVESNVHGRYRDDPAFEPVWAALAERGGILFVHPTSPPAFEATDLGFPRPFFEFMVDSTRALISLLKARVVARHPGLRVVIPHSGATIGLMADRISTLLPLVLGETNPVVADWDSQLASLWFDMAGTPFPRAVPTLTSLVGTSRILYGSDSCWTPSAGVDEHLATIDAADAPAGADSWRQLTADNAARLLG
jgi:predicted TIM-barrel fold metal-dependent hydrolase